MKIVIHYEASWRNSFLDGSNLEPLPKEGRNFVGSMSSLKADDGQNFIRRDITKDTIYGLLNRLVGDQRKLYQSRKAVDYYFASYEANNLVSFKDFQTKEKPISEEVVYLRNVKKNNYDRTSFSGMIKNFSGKYSKELWSVLDLDFSGVCQFILNPQTTLVPVINAVDPIWVMEKFNSIDVKNQEVASSDLLKSVVAALTLKFPEIKYVNDKGAVSPLSFYCSALYIQADLLKNIKGYDLSADLSEKQTIAGVSKRGFTLKDFMKKYTTGDGKVVYGNPYFLEVIKKGVGKSVHSLTKASGVLEIDLAIPSEEAIALKEIIDAAAVGPFYIGKKGLAYVEKIKI